MRGRSILKGLCVAGLLTCVVAVIAPAAYGDEGVLDDATGTVDTAVTDTTEELPSAEGATESATESAAEVEAVATDASTGDTVEEAAAPVPGATETAVTDSTTSVTGAASTGAPSTDATAPSTDATAPSSTGGGETGAGGTTPAAGAESDPGATSSAPATSAQQGMWIAASPRVGGGDPFLATARTFGAAAEDPEDVLDDLLGIGNAVGVDDVRGIQITNARGDAESAPGSDTTTPAPLALTGIAIGAFLALGVGLMAAGSGARSAGSASIA